MPYKGLPGMDFCLHVEALRVLQADLGRAVVNLGAFRQLPDLARYDEFLELYNAFVDYLRRLERDSLRADGGVDDFSGLRLRNMVYYDLAREQERLARNGRSFSLVMAHIDNFSEIHKTLDKKAYEALVRGVGKIIQKMLRSFDDAYYMDNGEFLLNLKQTDKKGGRALVERMREQLETSGLQVDGRSVSLSYCVSEPLPEDQAEQILADMRYDLKRYGDEAASAVEYIEQTPLSRYVQDQKILEE